MLKNKHWKLTRVLIVFLSMAVVSGCAATHTAVSKRDLDVQTRTSTAIFVDSVAKDRRTIYVEVKSGVMEFDRRAFRDFVKEQFANNGNGYTIVDEPDNAHFQMVVYVLNLEKADPSAADNALHSGYVGAAGGAAAGAAITGGYRGGLAGGVLGGIGSTIADAWVKDVTYMLVADVQIKEKAGKGVIVRKDTQISAKVSDAGTSTQRVSEATNKKEYRTRIVTTANKANLELVEAKDLMFKKTAYAMSGFF
jgi:hypothetical protein